MLSMKGGTWTGAAAGGFIYDCKHQVGRSYAWTVAADGDQVTFQELGWISGQFRRYFKCWVAGKHLYVGTK